MSSSDSSLVLCVLVVTSCLFVVTLHAYVVISYVFVVILCLCSDSVHLCYHVGSVVNSIKSLLVIAFLCSHDVFLCYGSLCSHLTSLSFVSL